MPDVIKPAAWKETPSRAVTHRPTPILRPDASRRAAPGSARVALPSHDSLAASYREFAAATGLAQRTFAGGDHCESEPPPAAAPELVREHSRRQGEKSAANAAAAADQYAPRAGAALRASADAFECERLSMVPWLQRKQQHAGSKKAVAAFFALRTSKALVADEPHQGELVAECAISITAR